MLVATTDAPLADPIVSLLIAGLILYSSYGVLRESATVLLEGTPAGMDMPAVIAAIKSVGGVLDVHDLHVWMVGPGVVACSCHIVVAEQSIREGQQVLRAVVHDIEHRFHITHTTVQVEVEGCEANDMYCMGRSPARRPGRGGLRGLVNYWVWRRVRRLRGEERARHRAWGPTAASINALRLLEWSRSAPAACSTARAARC